MITFIARLIRKTDGATYSAEFEAPADQASALIAAFEQFGLDNHVETIYPMDEHRRLSWPARPMIAAAVGPV